MGSSVMSLVEKARGLLDRVAELDGQAGTAASEAIYELQKVIIDLRLLFPAPPLGGRSAQS
jgi:hypothetical protein